MERGARGQSAAAARRLSCVGLVAAVPVAIAATAVLLRGGGAPQAADADYPARPTATGSGVEVRPADDEAGRERRHPLQHELVAMGLAERVSVLRLAIRDRALDCEDVTDVTALAGGMPVWRVACSGARAYIVGVDELGRIDIEQQFYHEPTVLPPTGPAPDREIGRPGPGPDRSERGPLDRFR